MFSSEVKIITVASQDSCNHNLHTFHRNFISSSVTNSSPSTTYFKNFKLYQQRNKLQQQQQQDQEIIKQKDNNNIVSLNFSFNTTNRKKNNNNLYSSQLNNRKKQQANNNNNNNKTIKNQNICSIDYEKGNTGGTRRGSGINRNNRRKNSNNSTNNNTNSTNSSVSINNSNSCVTTGRKLKVSKVNLKTPSSLSISSSISTLSPSSNHRLNTTSSTIVALECTNLLKNNLLENKLENCVVMNRNNNSKKTINNGKSTSCSTENASLAGVIKNNSSNIQHTTSSVISTATTSSTVSASYTLDFLHSVGMQMATGCNRLYSPSQLSVIKKVTAADILSSRSKLNNNNRNHSNSNNNFNNTNNSNNNNNNSNNNNNQQQNIQNQTRPTFKEYNIDVPPNIHPFRPYYQSIYPPYYQFIGPQYPGGAPISHGNLQQYSIPGYGQIYSPSNRNQHNNGKKWQWTQSNARRSNGTNSNKHGNGQNNNNNSNNNNSSQTLPRYRNQNHIRVDTNFESNINSENSRNSGHYNGNSRSPTPSPKSDSPSLYKTSQNSQLSVGTVFESNDISENCCWNGNNYNAINDGMVSSNSSSIDVQNGNMSLNGYDSDSSHSSYRYNFAASFDSGSYNHNYQPQIANDMTSLINFPTFSPEDNVMRMHAHYYGSQQNLAMWNFGPSTTFSGSGGGGGYSNGIIYNSSNATSTTTCNSNNSNTSQSEPLDFKQYSSETASQSSRRSHSHNRIFKGRRQIHHGFRGPHISNEHSYYSTPADRFLNRSHLIEVKDSPDTLLNGSKWDQLSEGIWNKFFRAQQREETFRKKMYLWRFLYTLIKTAYPRYGLYLVGSTISGFGADTSDVDMCLVSRSSSNLDPRMEAVINLNQLKDYLTKTEMFGQFNLIEAKVPILRFRDSTNLFEVDLNFNNCVGIRNTHLLHCYSQLDWRLRPLVLVVKLWAQFHNINNAKNMTISSYSLALMVIHFLQYAVKPPVLPCLHSLYPEKFQVIMKPNDFGHVDLAEEIESYVSQNTQTLGELFLQFLEYYSNFDYSQYAISIRTGSILPIETCRQAKSLKNDIHQWKELCIEEPFDLTNTARSVYDCETFERVKAVFVTSWNILQETLNIDSIFTPFIPATIMMPTMGMTMATSTTQISPIPSENEEMPISSINQKNIFLPTSLTNTISTNTISPSTSKSLTPSSNSSTISSEIATNSTTKVNDKNNSNNKNQVPLKIMPSIS